MVVGVSAVGVNTFVGIGLLATAFLAGVLIGVTVTALVVLGIGFFGMGFFFGTPLYALTALRLLLTMVLPWLTFPLTLLINDFALAMFAGLKIPMVKCYFD